MSYYVYWQSTGIIAHFIMQTFLTFLCKTTECGRFTAGYGTAQTFAILANVLLSILFFSMML